MTAGSDAKDGLIELDAVFLHRVPHIIVCTDLEGGPGVEDVAVGLVREGLVAGAARRVVRRVRCAEGLCHGVEVGDQRVGGPVIGRRRPLGGRVRGGTTPARLPGQCGGAGLQEGGEWGAACRPVVEGDGQPFPFGGVLWHRGQGG